MTSNKVFAKNPVKTFRCGWWQTDDGWPSHFAYNSNIEDSMAAALKKRRNPFRKIERIEIQLNPEQNRRLERAASLKGISISDFISSSADNAAAQAIQQHEVWALADRDRQVFMEALLHPPSPSARMKAALGRYRRRVVVR